MQTEAIFENISERILQEIRKARKSIYVAVAWFTNRKLFEELVIKAHCGCTVFLIVSNDDINRNSKLDFNRLSVNDSCVYKIGNGDTELMHNKFCVIDYSTVITGSYNWSYKAETNFENVIITNGDSTLASQFISEFNNIRKQYFPNESILEVEFPLNKIITRLEILKNYIVLEDIDEAKREASKLTPYDFIADLQEIINSVNNKEYSSAIRKIQNFLVQNMQLSIWVDTELATMKLEIKNLENQLNAYDNERIELEKLLSAFQHRHSIELGNIILEILKLKKIKFKGDKEKLEEAENDERQYQEQATVEKKKKIFDLTEEEKKDLKKKFRKATMLCHPDKISDEFVEAAKRIFIELKAAYEINNIKKVTEILNNLEKGDYLKTKSDTITEKDKLKVAIEILRGQIKNLEAEIIKIKESETLKTITSIPDLDNYFKIIKEKLEAELNTLKNDVSIAA